MFMTLSPWSAPLFFNAPVEESPSLPYAPWDVVQMFRLPPCTCWTDCSGHSIDTPPSLLVEAYGVANATAIAPWPPSSWTRARQPPIRGHDLFQHRQQKRGKDFLVMDSQGYWNSNGIELREARHPFERMKVVKLKPPWQSYLCTCLNLPMAAANSYIYGQEYAR